MDISLIKSSSPTGARDIEINEDIIIKIKSIAKADANFTDSLVI